MPFSFRELDLAGVLLVEATAYDDDRGYFLETYQHSAFVAGGLDATFVQDNCSRSRKDVFRGLHYQNPPKAQGKLVAVARGEILDVAVDIRRGSPTFGKAVTARLSDANHCMLYVPPGFAHGFLALSDGVDVNYKVTEEYSPEHDRGIIWNDPEIGLELPVDPILSPKDRALPRLRDADIVFEMGS